MPLLSDPSGVVEEVVDRGFDDAVNLGRVRYQLIRSFDSGDDRHDETGSVSRRHGCEPTQDLDDVLRRKAHFLPGLPLGCRYGVFVFLPSSPWEDDISRMSSHVFGATSEDDPGNPRCVLIEGDEHGVASIGWRSHRRQPFESFP